MRWREIVKRYTEKDKDEHKKEIGRYWASSIYSIEKGFITPENYFQEKEIDDYGVENIFLGKAIEREFLQALNFVKGDFQYEPKKEIDITDKIKLVVKPDFVFKDFVIEMKVPDKDIPNLIPEKWFYQLEAEARAFKKPVYLVIVRKHPLLSFIEYKPSEKIKNKIVNILVEFDKKLRKLYKNELSTTPKFRNN